MKDEPIAVRNKTCGACGRPFACCAGACWCDDVTLSPDTRADLRERYVDCLCAECLQSHASASRVEERQSEP